MRNMGRDEARGNTYHVSEFCVISKERVNNSIGGERNPSKQF
jgi:hypothetical protein